MVVCMNMCVSAQRQLAARFFYSTDHPIIYDDSEPPVLY